MATKPKVTPAKGFEATLKHKLGPLPVWAWALVGVGAVYVYKRATASRVPSTEAGGAATQQDQGYDSYGSYASGYQDTGGGGGATGYSSGAGGAVDTSSIPESIPLAYEGGAIPVKVTIKRPRRRHNRHPNRPHRPNRPGRGK